jgi:uncharacterized protein
MSAPKPPCYRVRRSWIHGAAEFATGRICAGIRIVESSGERLTHAAAERRYADRPASDNHTFLFSVDAGTVIDGGSAGNAARFINHSCAPTCTSTLVGVRIYLRALRKIQSGEELHDDYRIARAQRSAGHRADLRLPLRRAGLPGHAAAPAPHARRAGGQATGGDARAPSASAGPA